MFPYIYIISHIIQQLLQNNESIETKGNIGSRFVRHKTSMVALDTYGIIHLVSTQNFSKDLHFLSPDMHTCVCISGGKKS